MSTASSSGQRRFARIDRLPPYVFNITAELRMAKRVGGRVSGDVVAVGIELHQEAVEGAARDVRDVEEGLLHGRNTRITVLVDAVPEAHDPRLPGQRVQRPLLRRRRPLRLAQDVHHLLVRAAMQGASQRANRRRDRRVKIGQRGRDAPPGAALRRVAAGGGSLPGGAPRRRGGAGAGHDAGGLGRLRQLGVSEADIPAPLKAVEQAVNVDFEGVPTRMMTAEHLTAIALQTGRGKDFSRILAFIESGRLSADKLTAILHDHELTAAWAMFETKYLTNP